MPFVRSVAAGVRLSIRLQPGAKKPGVAGLHGQELKIKISSPPVDGAANQALIEFLADLTGVRKSNIEIISGHTTRSKLVEIRGLDEGVVRTLFKNIS